MAASSACWDSTAFGTIGLMAATGQDVRRGMQTFDEHQVEWLIKPTDRGKKLVTALANRNVDVVVLPRSVYLGEALPETLPPVPAANDPDLHYKLRERDCLFLLGVTKEA